MKIRPDAGWEELPAGGIIDDPGNNAEVERGSWRSERPIFHRDLCNDCLLCWIACPDSAFLVEDGKILAIDYSLCKGCGICVVECPPKVHALEMEPEAALVLKEGG